MAPPPAPDSPTPVETDDRFPSGPWTGFFLWPAVPGRHQMELRLTFRQGTLTGEGRDRVGEFLMRGRYQLEDGKCWWTKSYLGRHDVFYQGFNEGRGIWGTWEIRNDSKGGFHIWPEGMADPTQPAQAAEAETPASELEGSGVALPFEDSTSVTEEVGAS